MRHKFTSNVLGHVRQCVSNAARAAARPVWAAAACKCSSRLCSWHGSTQANHSLLGRRRPQWLQYRTARGAAWAPARPHGILPQPVAARCRHAPPEPAARGSSGAHLTASLAEFRAPLAFSARDSCGRGAGVARVSRAPSRKRVVWRSPSGGDPAAGRRPRQAPDPHLVGGADHDRGAVGTPGCCVAQGDRGTGGKGEGGHDNFEATAECRPRGGCRLLWCRA